METFEQQLKQLELKMEMNIMQMFNDFGQRFQIVMKKLEELVDECMETKSMIDDRMTQNLMAIHNTSSGNITPTIGNTPHWPQKMSRATPSPDPRPEPMSIDHPIQADGSLINNPPASHATHQRGDSYASASASKWVTHQLSPRLFFTHLKVTYTHTHHMHITTHQPPSSPQQQQPHMNQQHIHHPSHRSMHRTWQLQPLTPPQRRVMNLAPIPHQRIATPPYCYQHWPLLIYD